MNRVTSGTERRAIRWLLFRSNLAYTAGAIAWIGALVAYVVLTQRGDGLEKITLRLLIATGVVGAIVVITLAAISVAESTLAKAIQRRDPTAFLMPMVRVNTTMSSLETLGYQGRKVGSYFLLVVVQERVQIWSWSLRTEPLFEFAITDISRVDLSISQFGLGQRVAVICISVRGSAGTQLGATESGDVWLQMIPAHNGAFSAVPRYKLLDVERCGSECRASDYVAGLLVES